jgi:hypothetical protein
VPKIEREQADLVKPAPEIEQGAIMKFPVAKMKGIRTDLMKGKLHLAFEIRLDDETLRMARALAVGADMNNGLASVEVELAQPGLPGLSAGVVDRETGEIQE